MRRLICGICIVLLIFVSCKKPPEEKEENHTAYRIVFNTVELSNDRVGEEWSFSYKYDGNPVRSNGVIKILPNGTKTISIEVMVIERDNRNDVGTGVIKMPARDGGKGFTEVTVTENAGRYTGNSAVWRVTCTAKQIN